MDKKRLEQLRELDCFKDVLNDENADLIESLIQAMYQMPDDITRTFCQIYSNFAAELPTDLLVYACNNYKTLPEDRLEKAVRATSNLYRKLIMEAMAEEGL